jgi:hypothetical protein
MNWLVKLFSGGLVGSLERVALEAITTDQESAEAQSLMIKTLDPNGKMRRDLSRFACMAYGFYLVTAVILIFMHAFGIGDTDSSKEAMEAMTALFLPITASWATIVSASFGVNGVNTLKGAR